MVWHLLQPELLNSPRGIVVTGRLSGALFARAAIAVSQTHERLCVRLQGK
jgi:hypothetical protein